MSRVIEIPKELGAKDGLVVIPRGEYEELLSRSGNGINSDSSLWQKKSQKALLDSYAKEDSIYYKI